MGKFKAGSTRHKFFSRKKILIQFLEFNMESGCVVNDMKADVSEILYTNAMVNNGVVIETPCARISFLAKDTSSQVFH